MTCDLQKKPARNPKPFVMQGLLSCLALHLEIALIGTCLITILFSLLLKVEKDLLTLLLLSETTDSQFNCERSLRNFCFGNFEEAQVTIFGDYIFSPNELQTQNCEKWSLMSETILLLEICVSWLFTKMLSISVAEAL